MAAVAIVLYVLLYGELIRAAQGARVKPVYSQLRAESTVGGETTCIVCFAGPKTHLAVPCGHQCACDDCSVQLKSCPVCRAHATVWVKVHVA